MSLAQDFQLHQNVHLDALGNLSGGVPEGLASQLSELAPVVVDFETATTKIEQDRNLSPEGKTAARQAAREAAKASIDKWQADRLGGIDKQISQQQQALAKVDPGHVQPTEFAVRFMAEVMQKHDPLENDVLYASATDAERQTMELASDTLGRVPRRLPSGELMWEHALNPERVAAVRTARQAEKNPTAVSALTDARRIRNVYSAMASAAVELLGK